MSAISLACPKCRERIKLTELPAVGSPVSCSVCKHVFRFEFSALKSSGVRSAPRAAVEESRPPVDVEATVAGDDAWQRISGAMRRSGAIPVVEVSPPSPPPPPTPAAPAPAAPPSNAMLWAVGSTTAAVLLVAFVAFLLSGRGGNGGDRTPADRPSGPANAAADASTSKVAAIGSVIKRDVATANANPTTTAVEQKTAATAKTNAVQPPPADPKQGVALVCRVVRTADGRAVYVPLYSAWALDRRQWITRGYVWAVDAADKLLADKKLELHAVTHDRAYPITKIVLHPKFPAEKVRANKLSDQKDQAAYLLYDLAKLETAEHAAAPLRVAADANLESLRLGRRAVRVITPDKLPEDPPLDARPTIAERPTALRPLADIGVDPRVVGFDVALEPQASGSPLVDEIGRVIGIVVVHRSGGKGPDLTRIISINQVHDWDGP